MEIKHIAFILLLIGIGFSVSCPSGYSQAREFQINSTVSSDIAGGVLPLIWNSSEDIANGYLDANCNGLWVVNSSGDHLYQDLENGTCNTDETVLWVFPPVFYDQAVNQTVYVCLSDTETGDLNYTDGWESIKALQVFHFGEGAFSGIAVDSSGHWNGTYTGTGTIVNGTYGRGISLTAGTANFVQIGNPNETDSGHTTITMWGNATYATASLLGLWSLYYGAGGPYMHINKDTNNMLLSYNGGTDISCSMSQGVLYHWGAIQSSTTQGTIMQNGTNCSAGTGGTASAGSNPAKLGSDYTGQDRTFTGMFDEYRYYNETKSVEFVQMEYNAFATDLGQTSVNRLTQNSFDISPATLYINSENITCSVSYNSSTNTTFTASIGLTINGSLSADFNTTNHSYTNNTVWSYTFNAENYTTVGTDFSCWSEANDSATSIDINYTSNVSVTNLIPECLTIDEAGSFDFANDIYGANPIAGIYGITEACIVINTTGVTLNCSGYSMDANNTADATGILINATETSIVNCPSVLSYEKGIYFHNTEQGAIENSTTLNSTEGIFLYASTGINITNCTAYNSTKGIALEVSTSAILDSNIFFDSEYDFYANSSNYTMTTNYFTPDGTFTNYTNITIVDIEGATDIYSIDWDEEPAALPNGRRSFAQKYVNISTISGAPSIDELNWTWDTSELTGYNESNFELWLYNTTGSWNIQNSTPDTANNVLTLYNLEPESIYGILQNDTEAPEITISYPLNNSYVNASSFNFTFTATDNQYETFECNLTLDGEYNTTNSSVQNNTETKFAAVSLSEGVHNWSLTCEDGNGNIRDSGLYNFTIDTVFPTLTIESPTNTTYQTNNITVNYTTSAHHCAVLLDGSINQSLASCENTTIENLTQTQHYVTIVANSTANNSNVTSVYFIVDYSEPLIYLEYPPNGEYVNVSSFNFSFNYTDVVYVYVECNLTLDEVYNTTNSSVINSTSTNFEVLDLPDGAHNWSISCEDGAGNVGNSQTYNFTVDTIFPTLTVESPINTTYFVNYVSVNYTTTADHCAVLLNGAINQTLSSCENATIEGLSEGQHYVTVVANSTVNNSNTTDVYFIIDYSAPVIQEVTVYPATNMYREEGVECFVNATDNTHSNFTVLVGLAFNGEIYSEYTTTNTTYNTGENYTVAFAALFGLNRSDNASCWANATDGNVTAISYSTNTTVLTRGMDISLSTHNKTGVPTHGTVSLHVYATPYAAINDNVTLEIGYNSTNYYTYTAHYNSSAPWVPGHWDCLTCGSPPTCSEGYCWAEHNYWSWMLFNLTDYDTHEGGTVYWDEVQYVKLEFNATSTTGQIYVDYLSVADNTIGWNYNGSRNITYVEYAD